MGAWVYANYVNLADWTFIYPVVMDFGPTKNNNLTFIAGQKETVGIKPALFHAIS